MTRRGDQSAFETLVSRYQSKLLGFCRHMLGNREDAEDVLQEVFAAAYTAMLADNRPIMVKPWLYRIARNRSLNHMRRQKAVGVDSMDIHVSEHGLSTADRAHNRDEFMNLVEDIAVLPETQRTALLLREMDGLSYDQIADVMETTVPSVKSLLVRARVALAEMTEARGLTCNEVRMELGEVAEGLKRKLSPPVRRHMKSCDSCKDFKAHLTATDAALAAMAPIGLLVAAKNALAAHLGMGSGTSAAAGTAGSSAAAASGSITGAVTAGASAVATKAAASLAAAAIVTAGAVQVQETIIQPAAVAPTAVARISPTAKVASRQAPAPVAAAPIAAAPAPAATATVVPTVEPTAAAPVTAPADSGADAATVAPVDSGSTVTISDGADVSLATDGTATDAGIAPEAPAEENAAPSEAAATDTAPAGGTAPVTDQQPVAP